MLRRLQMFKFVLLRAVQTTAQVFCDVDVRSARRCREVVEEYNRQAEPVWKKEGADFLLRRRECKVLHSKLLGEVDRFPGTSEFRPIPQKAAAVLDSIFKAHYKSEEQFLLFGRTDDRSLEVQDSYGLAVAKALGKLDKRYEARAHLHLRKKYGRGAPLPLLSMASVEAMWETCTSYFYHIQISTVSFAVEVVRNYAERFFSFIRGLSRFRTSWQGWSTRLRTLCTGFFDRNQGRIRSCLELWV
jgi:hypothetical protein